jgi:hypothetical protein
VFQHCFIDTDINQLLSRAPALLPIVRYASPSSIRYYNTLPPVLHATTVHCLTRPCTNWSHAVVITLDTLVVPPSQIAFVYSGKIPALRLLSSATWIAPPSGSVYPKQNPCSTQNTATIGYALAEHVGAGPQSRLQCIHWETLEQMSLWPNLHVHAYQVSIVRLVTQERYWSCPQTRNRHSIYQRCISAIR